MIRYITYRLLLLVPVLVGISVVVFLLIHLIPGDVVDVLLGIQTSPEAAIALRRIFGLDQPMHVQFFSWASSLLRGDLGLSLEAKGEYARANLIAPLHLAGHDQCLVRASDQGQNSPRLPLPERAVTACVRPNAVHLRQGFTYLAGMEQDIDLCQLVAR